MSTKQESRQQQAKVLRMFRKVHRTTGALLFIFFFIISVTGLMLGWKKNSSGLILAKSYKGQSTNSKNWLTVDSLRSNAVAYLKDSIDQTISSTIDRIDFRPEKGMVKFVFTDHFTALQIDATTGTILHVEQRRADYIEKIHDGSIVDHYLHIPLGTFKLIYTTIMGLALLLFTITGFWLWYGPKRMRRQV